HPDLILPDDGKQVTHGNIWQKLLDKPERFSRYVIVIGRFYFEVQVKGKTAWTLGVAGESIDRKGEITLRPSNGYWTVQVKPQRVGVFVDYEEGLVSFYGVESSSHIYSFT
ncbi:hypothetical protein M9458_038714, partial [Cirrhinus mrigala]